MAKMTVKEVLDRVESPYGIVAFIRDGDSSKMYDEEEFQLIPQELLNKVVKKRNIKKFKFVTHVELWV